MTEVDGQSRLDDLWTPLGRLETESRKPSIHRPPSRFINGRGYAYYQVRSRGERFTVNEHQLVELAKDREPECDPEECPCSRRGPCPYRVFSNGAWQVHHENAVYASMENELGRLLRGVNYPSNLSLERDEDHGRETYENTIGKEHVDDVDAVEDAATA